MSVYWTNSGRSLPVLFHLLLFKKRFATESVEWIHRWSHSASSFCSLYNFFSHLSISSSDLFPLLVDFSAQHNSCLWPGKKKLSKPNLHTITANASCYTAYITSFFTILANIIVNIATRTNTLVNPQSIPCVQSWNTVYCKQFSTETDVRRWH